MLDVCQGHMYTAPYSYEEGAVTMSRGKYTKQELIELAKPYKTRTGFKAGERGAYASARRQGLLDTICAHMSSKLTDFTKDQVVAIAKLYPSKTKWARSSEKEHRKAYDHSVRKGWHKEACKHMPGRKLKGSKYSAVELSQAARKYRNKTQFRAGDPARYKAAFAQGLLDDFFGESVFYTEEAIAEIAAKAETRGEFKDINSAAYTAARRLGVLDAVCSHMDGGNTGFKPHKPATFYYLRVESSNGEVLYKPGITGRTLQLRFLPRDMKKITVLHTEAFDIGKEAASKEREIKNANKKHRYKGKPVLTNGNTELFTRDILNLDN